MLKRHLLALANPVRHTEAELRDESGDWKPLRRRLGEAFIEYVERYPAAATPQTAGVNATVVVTMTLDQLLAEHATALLDDGSRMSAGQARRLACEAGIIPVVLDSKSQPLDIGRAARLFTRAQRIALGLRDGGCTAKGCETSASGCWTSRPSTPAEARHHLRTAACSARSLRPSARTRRPPNSRGIPPSPAKLRSAEDRRTEAGIGRRLSRLCSIIFVCWSYDPTASAATRTCSRPLRTR